jgi:hypothetical protein
MTKMGVRRGRSPYANDLVVVGEFDFLGVRCRKMKFIYLFFFVLVQLFEILIKKILCKIYKNIYPERGLRGIL